MRLPVVDVIAAQEHFRDHTLPVYLAMPPEMRGAFYTDRALDPGILRGIERSRLAGSGDLTLTCSVGDMRFAEYGDSPRPIVFMEHGAGFTFEDSDGITLASYSGSYDRRNVALFLNVNSYVDENNLRMHPHTAHAIIGSPKLDEYTPPPPSPHAGARPTVAIAFHWDCHLAPGTRSAYEHFRSALPALAAEAAAGKYDLIAHAHPRMKYAMQMEAATYGIEFVPHLPQVFERADLFVADATSAMYEFAALDRPVVVMNAPWYFDEADDGVRFWREIPGLQVDDPARLTESVRLALDDGPALKAARRAAVENVYPYRGTSAQRAVDAIITFAKEIR